MLEPNRILRRWRRFLDTHHRGVAPSVLARRARHLRAMVIWEKALLALPAECPCVEKDEHKTRFHTLQAVARQYRTHPDRFGVVYMWRPRHAAALAPSAHGALRDLRPRAAE